LARQIFFDSRPTRSSASDASVELVTIEETMIIAVSVNHRSRIFEIF